MALRQKYTVDIDGVLEANFGPVADAATGEMTIMCDLCGVPYPKSKTVTFRGRVYGVPCGDSADIQGILKVERAKAYRPPKRKPERESTMTIE